MADLRVLEGVKIVDAVTPANSVNVDASGNLTAILAANSGVDIGDVDVTSIIPGTAASNLGKAEDAASAGGDTLVGMAAVQDAALTALGSVDDDYTWLRVNANGALWVEDVNSSGGVTHVDDAAFTPASDDIVPIGGMFDDTTPDSVDEGDAGVVRMSANRNLYSTLRDAAGNERGANVTASNELNVLATAQPGVDIGDVTIADFAAAETDSDDDSIADSQTSLRTLNLNYGYDGAAWERLVTDGSGALNVAVTSGGGEALPTNPVRTSNNSTDTAAGATFSLDGPESGGSTTTTRGFDVAASVPVKAELQTVADGTGTTILSLFAQAGENVEWRAPHRDFFDTAHPANAGFDGFRLVITNLDNENAANLYATLYTED